MIECTVIECVSEETCTVVTIIRLYVDFNPFELSCQLLGLGLCLDPSTRVVIECTVIECVYEETCTVVTHDPPLC